MSEEELRACELALEEEIGRAEAEAAAMVEQARKAQEAALLAARGQTDGSTLGDSGPVHQIDAAIEARLTEAERAREHAIAAAEELRRKTDAEWAAAEAEMARHEAETEAELAAAEEAAERAEAPREEEQNDP